MGGGAKTKDICVFLQMRDLGRKGLFVLGLPLGACLPPS